MDPAQILEQLTEAYARRDLLRIEYEDAKNSVIPEEVKTALSDVDLEYAPKKDAVDEKISSLEAQAKQAILEAGETIKGGALQAVYVKGRVSWDTKKLDGLMIVIPELAQARKQGDPTVTIRKIG